MAQLLNLTGPMMRRGTSFHANETGRQLAEESQHPTALQLPAGNRLSRTINAVHLEDVLRNIKTNYANLIHAWLLPGGSLNTATLAHRDAGGGAVHSIMSRHKRCSARCRKSWICGHFRHRADNLILASNEDIILG
jgi:hypothetical protein